MKLTFHQSATVTIELENVKVLCDPWLVDGEYFGSWAQYPPYDFKPEKFDDIDFIYVSHIHPDHCGAKTLSKLRKDIPVLIHNFPHKFLKNYIENFGFKVKELEHNKRIRLKNDLHINILAADNCNPEICGRYFGCSFLETKFGATQIDTMSVIENGKEIVVNTNDCPIELSEETSLRIKQTYKNIDMLLVGYAGALCFPQCFDYPQEKLEKAMKIKKQRYFTQAEKFIKLFDPKYFMPFAGRYTLAGPLYKLNKKLGIPELEEGLEYLNSKFDQNKNKGIILNSDTSFDITLGKLEKPYEPMDPKAKEDYIKNVLSSYKFDFEEESVPTTDELMSFIPKAYQRFESKRKELHYSSDWTILLDLSTKEILALSCSGGGFKIIPGEDANRYRKFLRFTVDPRLLKWLLMGPKKAHWNNAEIGSHICFKRFPDIYDRAIHYCFNWFYA